MKERRRALGWNQLEVQANGGPSNTTQTTIENAKLEDLTPATARKVDAGLGWGRGSAMRIWRDEGEPWLNQPSKLEAIPQAPDRFTTDIAAEQVFTDRTRRMQVGETSVHGLLAVVSEEVTSMARRIQDLEAELAELHAVRSQVPLDLAARQTGRRGGAETARSAQDKDAEDPGV